MSRRLARRDFLYVGFVGGIGLSLADFFRMREARADQKFYESKEGTAKSVIFIFLPGGMAHQESFDPKPFAPVEYRGPLGSIDTNVEGVRLGELWQQTAQVRTIHFDYDRTDLRPADREILKANAEFLKSNTELSVLVEGHCDERGTTEYNLALGQKRAAAVRNYYGQLGVPLGRIGTISYGEEIPIDAAHTENAWAKNRRAETKVRSGNQ